jgi:hypothetical protein
MAKTETAKWMDELQAKLRPFLKDQGFRMRARTCNRETAEGLTHVINFQMGRFDPPGAPEIPELRDNLYGMFTVNVGVRVPEINIVTGLPASPFVQEPDCCIRRRLGHLSGSTDVWWRLPASEDIASDLRLRFERYALPFLARFQDRDCVLYELEHQADVTGGPPRISRAIILATRGETDAARELLMQQLESASGGHAKYVQEIARRLNLGELKPDRAKLD